MPMPREASVMTRGGSAFAADADFLTRPRRLIGALRRGSRRAPPVSWRKPPPGPLRVPRGKAPSAIVRTPFAASVRNASAYIVFLHSSGLRSAAAVKLTAAASLAALLLGCTRFSFRPAKRKPRSPPARSRATRSHRPFAISCCRRLFLPVTRTGVCPLSSFIFHLSSLISHHSPS